MNGNILNGSVNGSSVQSLNNSNKFPLNKMIANNDSFPSNINEKDQNNEEKEESIDSILKISKKIIPNSLKISFFLMIISFFIFISITAINMYKINSQAKNWDYYIYLSINILEGVPSLLGMIIYVCNSIIAKNFTLIEGSPFKKNQVNYLTYFEAKTLYYSEDVMKKYFSKSYFGELLRDNLRISYNLDNYINEAKQNLINTLKWAKLLNTDGYFCIYASLGEMLSNLEPFSTYDLIKNMNDIAKSCENDNTGINGSGMELQVKYIIQEITYKYIEFITYNISNKKYDELRDSFFNSKEIRNIFLDLEYSIAYYFNTMAYAVNLDFDIFNKSITEIQKILVLCLLFINIFVIIFLSITMFRDEKHKQLFGFFSEIPKIN